MITTLKLGKKVVKKDLESKGFKVSLYAEELLDKVTFKKGTVELIVKSVSDLGISGYPTTEQIYAKAKKQGLDLCPAEVGPALRMAYTDQPLYEWLYLAMEPITGSGGYPIVFRLGRDADGLWLDYDFAGPRSGWGPDDQFVFRLRKSLGKSETLSDPLVLSRLDALEKFKEKVDRMLNLE